MHILFVTKSICDEIEDVRQNLKNRKCLENVFYVSI